MKKNQYRDYIFETLTKHVGKGKKNLLKRIKLANENNKVIKECQDRTNIEAEIARYNKKHFRQSYSSKAFKDRIYSQLKYNEVRDKILNGTLQRNECDNQDVYDFLKLLKKPEGYS